MADRPATPRASPPLTPMQQLAARLAEWQCEASSNNGHGADSVPGSPVSDAQNLPPSNSNSPINSNGDNGGLASNPSSPTSGASNWLAGNEVAAIAATTTLAYLAPALKRARKLGPQASTELDIFLASSSSEKEGYQYALALACHDKLTSLVGHLDYKVPPTLSVTAKDYAWAFMLSPTITSYRYAKILPIVLNSMHDLNIADVPPKCETGRCMQVEKVIRQAITQCHHHIKDKVVSTFNPGPNDAIDIASLAAVITSSTKVKPTVALYMRITLIRWVVQEWPETHRSGNDADESFWLKVDEQLREQVAEFKTPTKIQEACQALYEADKQQYGQPDLISHPMTPAHLQDDWIMALGDKSATLPQSKSQGKKRTRSKAGTF